MVLTLHEQRVLGSLIEKEIVTPEGYPLSLNALVNACNQRSSRDPILDLSEEEVRNALDGLQAWELTASVRDSRVPKFEHRARTVLQLRRDETAVLCLLLLRGPQTSGELRSRSDRLYRFEDLAMMQTTLDRLGSREPTPGAKQASLPGALVVVLPRQPGSRESRYVHLLGSMAPVDALSAPSPHEGTTDVQRLAHLEDEIAKLQRKLDSLGSKVSEMKRGT